MASAFVRVVLALALLGPFAAVDAVPLEVYGKLPQLEDIVLSPDGSRIAYVKTLANDQRVLEVTSLADNQVIAGLQVGDTKLRGLEWADDDHLLIETSTTSLPRGLVGQDHEWFQLLVYDVDKQLSRFVPDFRHLHGVNAMNVISGHVSVRRIAGHTVLFVPGIYLEQQTEPMLVRVDLETGIETVERKATTFFQQWLVGPQGEIAAERKYDEEDQRWSIGIRRGDTGLQAVLSGKSAIDVPQILGFGSTPDTVLIVMSADGKPVWRLLSLADGSLGPPLANNGALQSPIEERLGQRMIGGSSTDDDTRYVFFDAKLQAHWGAVLRSLPAARVRFVSTSDNFTKIIVRVEGTTQGFEYLLVDLITLKTTWLGDVYAGVETPLEVRRITYPAADGLPIPAYLTLPRGRAAQKLPLIVLPHGGPATRDTADFDWISQALAEQGYAVLRPNYRGSTISQSFLTAGFGEFGRKMQTDLSDGVRYLAARGIVDPARVCIAGASYGGYAALAGVTLDPDVYRCAVSIAGIADLKEFLDWVNDGHGSHDNLSQRYWDRFLGVSGSQDPLLDRISPIKHLDALKAPVLLIHGRDDTVVPFAQSEDMADAMYKAKKDVSFVTLKNEDHWLSHSETRLQMLRATVDFLKVHNPPDEPTANPAP